MEKHSYDFAVIGGGSAGYAAARTASGLGLRTVVIEGGDEVGGLCILKGCMPSKALIASANVARTVRHSHHFGIHSRIDSIDGSAVIARKRKHIGEFADYRREQLESGRFDFLRGRAHFLSPHEVEVDPSGDGEPFRVSSRTFLIATGSTHALPAIDGLAGAGPLTSDDILECEELPESLIVLGAGPVALEMAHYVESLGTEVTIIQRSPQFLRGIDADVAGVVEHSFRQRGMNVFTDTRLQLVRRDHSGVTVTFQQRDREISVSAKELFNGLGRRPATASLGLEAAGVKTHGATISAGRNQQTSTPHIFAAGDCCGPFEVVHIAISQGEIAARNAARLLRGRDPDELSDYRLGLYAIFTEPQVAVVGLTEISAQSEGIAYLSANYPFNDHGKSIVSGHTEGFVKLLADPNSGEILGAAVVGPSASDLIHEVVVAMAFHSTVEQFAVIPHYHPTLSEIWTYPAGELSEKICQKSPAPGVI